MTQENRLQNLLQEIQPLRQKLIDHKVYAKVKSVEDLKLFMGSHIYAVWDFMSLLKFLQIQLTCITVPWIPVGNSTTRYLINEIVTDEESDVDEQGNRMSHFELYLQAMKNAGAETKEIEKFIDYLKENTSVRDALVKVNAPPQVIKFVNSTFEVIELNKPYIAAAVFTFGREDLIPGMFISFVRHLHKSDPERFSIFKYYLERHIEVDGDHHAHLAHEMTALLCGDDDTKWREATEAVKQGLQARIDLWDGIDHDLEILNAGKTLSSVQLDN